MIARKCSGYYLANKMRISIQEKGNLLAPWHSKPRFLQNRTIKESKLTEISGEFAGFAEYPNREVDFFFDCFLLGKQRMIVAGVSNWVQSSK